MTWSRCLNDRYTFQAAKDVRASQDILIELFGRMEFFFKRLEAYIKVRPTTAMTDIIVKIVVEVISILGIVTKEIRQGRLSMPFLVEIFLEFDVSRREVSEDATRNKTCRGRFSTAGQIDARGSSHGSSRKSDDRSPD